ncbi:MAG: HNH endonuclease [Bacteroidales bacterium]|nr:HNH endonuclease [Bacteroidales bacterium]MCF8402855.1 HNH endonuclease [Bacteroidales bacterium]
MRNPKWHRDEIILALDLYLCISSGKINHSNPDIIELSRLLNLLPIHEERPDAVKFRNPNGVSLKLGNLLAVDPNYQGKGMERGGRLDKLVFEEFIGREDELHRIAQKIKETINNPELNFKLYQIPNDKKEIIENVREGQVVYKLHKYRERNTKIIKLKKEQQMDLQGKLECEACTFDFAKGYGKIGEGFIECHHKLPLSEIEIESITKIDDLALVCPNCHRVLHRGISTMNINQLKNHLSFSYSWNC